MGLVNENGQMATSALQGGTGNFIISGSETLLAENRDRQGLQLLVDSSSSAAAYLLLGTGTCSASSYSFILNPGGSWDGLISNVLWQGPIQAYTATPVRVGVIEC